MNTVFLLRYEWLRRQQHSGNAGFTLVELLVVVVIIGILTAIALPAFLAQSAKAKQSEAKTTLSAWLKGQQLYRYEYGHFGSFNDISVGMPADTKNYS